jgi:GNAT superfamily N-acetyltransferase
MLTLAKTNKAKFSLSPRPDIEHWWAAEAMIASYNHVYQVTYNTRYETHGPIGVTIYNDAPVASFQYEFLALSEDIETVINALHEYQPTSNAQYVIDTFHANPSEPELKQQYAGYGYEFVRTGPIFGIDLPKKTSTIPRNVHKATSIQQAETANHSLTTEGERIYTETLRDKNIHSFYITVGGDAVGWLQLVTVYQDVGYINQLYVLESYRRRKFGMTLVQYAHMEALQLGLKKMVLIPSEMSIPLYRRLGYRPLLYFSVFQPCEAISKK